MGASLPATGGGGAEVLWTDAGASEVVVGGSVGADDRGVKKEAGIVDGSIGESLWADGNAMAESSEMDGV